ncbi:S-layer homology domain-containing protein [bacterium]|nr:S-layer homology domain-containing protein [bacterium]NCQ55622.1 S-layer homology domain-containing protein [Candidatus Parcubacteria bacterium]NCS67447.1 S-layer homology domain-containing protein [Candidatus Peregrinibacteria bacterium]NCS96173.1 S-layer homology domain-containing protein [bacterium]
MLNKKNRIFIWKRLLLALPAFLLLSFNVSLAQSMSDGTLQVTLSNETARGTNIPFNASSVPFTSVELTAGDSSDVEISSITFTRLGEGSNIDFKNVWLEVFGVIESDKVTVNNDNIARITFSLPLKIPAGQTIIAEVVASLSETSKNIGNKSIFGLLEPKDIATTASIINSNFPIKGEEMLISEYETTLLKFSTSGNNSEINVGDKQSEIGAFSLMNSTDTNKDLELRFITFKNIGTASLKESLTNTALYVSDQIVSAETYIEGNDITFYLDNGVTGGVIIEEGVKMDFIVKADIDSAEMGDFIKLEIENLNNIVGLEIGTNFGAKVVTSTNESISQLKSYAIKPAITDSKSSVNKIETVLETMVETEVEEDSTSVNATAEVETEVDLSVYGLDQKHWGVAYVEALAQADVIAQSDRDLFQANEALNRRAFTKIILKAFGIAPSESVTESPFIDVSNDDSFAPYAAKAKELKIIEGYEDKTFRPTQTITRVEALKIILETAQTLGKLEISGGNMDFPDTTPASWYESYVAYAQANAVVSGYADGLFRPGNNVTGAETAKMVSIVVGIE